MEEAMKSAEFVSKNEVNIPADATVTKKSHRLTVREIENGFIIDKSYDIEYTTANGDNKYEYYTKSWYSKTNPMTIKMNDKEETLSDNF